VKFGFIPIEGGTFYDDFLAEVLIGEELGFDSVWLDEHHSVRNHYWPSPLMCFAGVSKMTSRILMGTDVIVMPFYHPVRLAEDAAMLDIMSGGRFILGAAIGYKPDEFELYQVPLKMRGARFEEAVQLIKQLWTQEEVNFEGTYYQVHGLKIEPRPITDPHPPFWLGGWGKLSLSRAAQYGDAWLPGPTANLEKLLSAQKIYHENLKKFGLAHQKRETPLTREVVIAETDQAAREMAEKHLLVNYRDEYGGGEWKHPLIGNEDEAAVDVFETIAKDRFIVGSPESVVKKIEHLVDTFGVDHLICRLYFPGLPHEFIVKELKLLAKEVIPEFRK